MQREQAEQAAGHQRTCHPARPGGWPGAEPVQLVQHRPGDLGAQPVQPVADGRLGGQVPGRVRLRALGQRLQRAEVGGGPLPHRIRSHPGQRQHGDALAGQQQRVAADLAHVQQHGRPASRAAGQLGRVRRAQRAGQPGPRADLVQRLVPGRGQPLPISPVSRRAGPAASPAGPAGYRRPPGRGRVPPPAGPASGAVPARRPGPRRSCSAAAAAGSTAGPAPVQTASARAGSPAASALAAACEASPGSWASCASRAARGRPCQTTSSSRSTAVS